MPLTKVLDQVALFEMIDDSAIPPLSVRESRLLVGAVNFHTAVIPDRELTFHVYDGPATLTPRTTDDRTFDGMSRIFRRRLYSFTARSTLQTALTVEDVTLRSLARSTDRHLYIPSDDVLDYDPRRWVPTDPLRKAARLLRNRAPLFYDELRDVELMRHRRHERRPVERRDFAAEFAPGGSHETELLLAPDRPQSARPAVLIGVHWFELGGAERWAFETVRIVKEAGLLPIVVSNVDSQHPFLTRPELDGALILPLSEPTSLSQPAGSEPLLTRLLETFELRGVVVHHNQWLYDRLPWLAHARPELPIMDSTHIVEHRGGGYAVSAVLADRAITTHHVISPTLARWMTDVQQVDRSKVVMAPLLGLTVDEHSGAFRARSQDEPFTVAFVGRMARQKAPEVFVEAARRIRRADPSIRFIVHGDGEHSAWVDDLVARGGLGESVERRNSSASVADTLRASHVLVVTSANEGLTLTTLEAIAHGLPVVSTDVGAQGDIIPAEGLVPASPWRAVRATAEAVLRLSRDEQARQALWSAEYDLERKLTAHESASAWFERTAHEWSTSPQ